MSKLSPQEFPFCGGTDLRASPVLNASRSINLYPEKGYPGSKGPYGLIGRPGTKGYAVNPFGGFNPYGGGMWAGNGRLFAAMNSHVAEIKTDGTLLTDYGVGGGPAGLVAQFSHNGSQMLVCWPDSNWINYVDPAGPAQTNVLNGTALDYLDGFFIAIASAADLAGSNPNQINCTGFMGNNFRTWNSGGPAYVIRSGTADLPIALKVVNGLLWIFGLRSTEIWYNAGNSPFPFARIATGELGVGTLSRDAVVAFADRIVWLGCDQSGYAQVYETNGTSYKRVSTPGVEQMIANFYPSFGVLTAQNLATAFATTQGGHRFYCLRLCTAANHGAQMLVYDIDEQLWHERTYNAFFPSAASYVPNFASASSPQFVQLENGTIQYETLSAPSDNGYAITYTRTAPHISKSNEWVKYPRFELDGDFGTAQPMLTYSNDGGRNFSPNLRAMQQAIPQGNAATSPEFRRFFALQLGRSRDRVFQVQITDSTNLIRIANAFVTIGDDE